MNDTSLNRFVTLHEPINEDPASHFIDYLSTPNLILLGDPGMGKTHTFKSSATYEDGRYMTVRSFLATKGKDCENSILYLDALDEYRSRSDSGNLIIELVQYLSELNLKAFRLSCRAADWFGESDLELFRGLFDDEKYAVVGLNRLTTSEIISLLRTTNTCESPELFYSQAENRGLDGLLGNPQTLLMLADLVSSDNWPKSRTELFEKSVEKLLAEVPSRSREGLGLFTAHELALPAGAVCSALLISSVAGISLLSTTTTSDFPTYREINLAEQEKIRSSLTRRAFQLVDPEKEAFSYVHRTIAEFLAARWIVAEIRSGFPIRRFQNLVGVEGVPTSELRGLYAWVTTMLPEYACVLIDSDPLGIALYGDASNLEVEARAHLLDCLQNLSIEDPWFRKSTNWASEALGSLSGSDMVEPFSDILNSESASFHFKNLILASIKIGQILPGMMPTLSALLINTKAAYSERKDAAEILISMGAEGRKTVVGAYHGPLSADKETVELRIGILRSLYSGNFSPKDICNALIDYMSPRDDFAIGDLWGFETATPIKDAIEVLDELLIIFSGETDDGGYQDSRSELARYVGKLISRVLDTGLDIESEKLYAWLLWSNKIERNSRSGKSNKSLEKWLVGQEGRKKKLFKAAFSAWDGENNWLWFNDFSESTSRSYVDQEFIDMSLDILQQAGLVTKSHESLYCIAGQLIFSISPPDRGRFHLWGDLAIKNNSYSEGYEDTVTCPFDGWRKKDNFYKKERVKENAEGIKTELDVFQGTKDMMASGEHRHNLSVLSRHYFKELTVDVPPIDSLALRAGEDVVPFVLDGFYAELFRDDLPSSYNLGKGNGTYFSSWYIVLAGMDEAWRRSHDLSKLPDEAIKTAFSLSFILSVFIRQGSSTHSRTTLAWVPEIVAHRPDLAMECIDQLSRGALDRKCEVNKGVHALLTAIPEDASLEPAFQLVSDYPNMHHDNLAKLISLLLYSNNTQRQNLLDIAGGTLSRRGLVKGRQRAVWLVAGFMLSPGLFRCQLSKYMKTRSWVVWIIRDLLRMEFNQANSFELSLLQLEYFSLQMAKHFENRDVPSTGWSGTQSSWEASEIIKGLIYRISSNATRQASEILGRLKYSPEMKTYSDYIAHSLYNQIRSLREAEYTQPDWSSTLRALSNREPANAADLHALLSDHLDSLKAEIRQAPTSIFRRFWRHGPRGCLVAPDIEDHCRDHLISLLKPRLTPLGIRVEPECHMSDDKRADIVAYLAVHSKLPLELKRDFHSDMWTACKGQLEKLYTPDPEASGYGIYVVFWFGEERGSSMPPLPAGIEKPLTSEDLERTLNLRIPADKRHRLIAKVLDVSSTINSMGESKVSA